MRRTAVLALFLGLLAASAFYAGGVIASADGGTTYAARASCSWQIGGRFVDRSGEPVAGVTARLEAASIEGRASLRSREVESGRDGRFRLGTERTDSECEGEWKATILAKVPGGKKWGATVSVTAKPVDGGFGLPDDVVISLPPDGPEEEELKPAEDRPAGPDGEPLCECGLGPGDPVSTEVRPGVWVTIQDECGYWGYHYCDNCEC